MSQPILMPKLGQSDEVAPIVKWRKRIGEAVNKGDILFEIETEKAVLEVESFYAGNLIKIVGPAGQAAPVNAIVAFLGKPGEKAPDVAAAPASAAATASPGVEHNSGGRHGGRPSRVENKDSALPSGGSGSVPTVAAPLAASAVPSKPGRLLISPRARALANTSCIDPSGIAGSGPDGRIVEKDVRAHLDARGYDKLRISPAAKALAAQQKVDILAVTGTGEGGRIMTEDIQRAMAERPKPLTLMRQTIARRLTQSVVTSPHFYVTVSVDMGDLLKLRQEAKTRGSDYSVTDFILEACIMTLQEVPEVNSSTDGQSVRWHASVHLGLATSRPDGLVVPVIRDAQKLTLVELHQAAKALAARARDGKLLPEEMSGSTFTVSNMGMLNVENFTAIINPGESAILAVSSTLPTPVARDGNVVVRPIMKITLASDHRLVDGAMAARFVNAIKTKLEDVSLWTRSI